MAITTQKIAAGTVGAAAGTFVGFCIAGPVGALALGKLGALYGAHLADK